MKKIIINVTILLTIISLTNCSDQVIFKKSDIEKYPWLVSYTKIFEMKDFSGKHNTDIGVIAFSFSLSDSEINSAFSKIDKIIDNEEWRIKQSNNIKRVITKVDKHNSTESIEIEITLDTKDQRLSFLIN